MSRMADAVVECPQQPGNSTGTGPRASGSQRSPSPPPNCAICLGVCINKCFSDSCMHQFCFKCLQEWSKVKAVCPLCKQPFTSIIHNVRANNEYEQYYILEPGSSENRLDELFLPRGMSGDSSTNTSRHFQFRTTLTVDPRGELAIQQLLSTHFNSMNIMLPIPSHYMRTRRATRHDITSATYRRTLYDRNMWTLPLVDVTGRFRETSPAFYRENPAATNRLVPFIRRELFALMPDETFRIVHLAQRILVAVSEHPIRSRHLRQLLERDLGAHTQHFIHELYTYARSPFDLIGYDRHAEVQPQPPADHEHESDDSDVLFVSVERAPPRLPVFAPEVIEIPSESSDNSDVVIREPTPPVVVDLASTTESSNDGVRAMPPATSVATRSKTARRNAAAGRGKRRVCRSSSSSSSDADATSTSSAHAFDTSSTTSSSSSAVAMSRKRQVQRRTRPPTSSSSDCVTSDSSSQASVKKEKRKRLRTRKQRSRATMYTVAKKRLKLERNEPAQNQETDRKRAEMMDHEESQHKEDEAIAGLQEEKYRLKEEAPGAAIWNAMDDAYALQGIDQPGPSNLQLQPDSKEPLCARYSDSD